MINLKRALLGISMVVSGVCLVGCWDSVEISNRSVILEFAVDKNDEYVPSEETPIGEQALYNVTYSIPDMAKLSGTEGLAEDMKTNVEVKAPTIGTSVDILETKTRNTLSFGNVKAIMIGDTLLQDRKLFKQTIDSMLREMLVPRNVPILGVKGKASDAVQIQNSQQPIVGLYIMNFFDNKERAITYFKPQTLGEFVTDLQDTGIATIPLFKMPEEEESVDIAEGGSSAAAAEEEAGMGGMQGSPKEGDSGDATEIKGEIDISGAALIKDYKLIDYLTKEEVRGQLLIEGKIKNAPIVVEYKGKPVTYKIHNHKSKMKFTDINDPNKMRCQIDMRTTGSITEYSSDDTEDRLKEYELQEIKQLIEQQLMQEAQLAIDKSREVNLDFLGIGQEMYRREPEAWDQVKHEWYEDTYKYLGIDVKSTIDIKGTGTLQ